MAEKLCPHCGLKKNARGFSTHVDACAAKNKPNITEQQVFKMMPTLEVYDGMIKALEVEKRNNRMNEVESIKGDGECNCVNYDGDSYTCPLHKSVNECPKCHCLNVEIKLQIEYGLANYRCGMCGEAYGRIVTTGEYLID
jgi:hypothetical protein